MSRQVPVSEASDQAPSASLPPELRPKLSADEPLEAEDSGVAREKGREEEVTHIKGRIPPRTITNLVLIGLFCYATIYTLYFARQLILPILLAILINFLLSPIVRNLRRIGIPRPISAFVLLSGLLIVAFVGSYKLTQPATEFAKAIPGRLKEIEHQFREIVKPVEEIAATAEEIEKVAADPEDERSVMLRGPGLIEIAIGYARSFGAGVLVTVVLLMFMLSLDEIFLHKIVRVIPTMHDKKVAVEIIRQIERDVSRYLLTVTVINLLLGFIVGALLWMIGIENPVMWAVFVAAMNYIPYVGSVVSFAMLTMVGIMNFNQPLEMALPPLIFLGCNVVEAYGVTPYLLGRRLDLNPVILVASLAFWGFIWGIPGMLIAVPLLVVIKLICDHLESTVAISEFLSGSPD